MKSYHIKPGLIISLSIGCIFSLRKLIPLKRIFPQRRFLRIDETGLGDIILTIFTFFIFSFCCWLLHQYFVQRRFPVLALNSKWVKGIAGIALCILLSHGIEYLFQAFLYNPLAIGPLVTEEEGPIRKILFLNVRGFIIGGFQFFMTYYINVLEEAQKAKIEIERLKQENLETRLHSLKQQLSPHFLFNSLSTLKTMVADVNARQYVMQLANVYRYLLAYNSHHLATLENELAFTHSYLYILKERFEDALQVDIQVPDDYLAKKMPPLSLQILMENAIKHNVVSPDDPLYVKIYTNAGNMLVVENNVQPKLYNEESMGKGLQSINSRYLLLSEKQIEIDNNANKFIVKLPLLV